MLPRITVLISGQGTNLQALIDGCQAHRIRGEIVAVISDRAEAYGLQRAATAGISTYVIDKKMHQTTASLNQALLETTQNTQPDLVLLSGFMRILSPEFVQHYADRLLNIHPSLLPKYKGLNTHARALEAGDEIHGCSVHCVTEELDGGPIIAQAKCLITNTDSVESLQKKIQQLEHILFPLCVAEWTTGHIQKISDILSWRNQTLPKTGRSFTADQLIEAWQSYEQYD